MITSSRTLRWGVCLITLGLWEALLLHPQNAHARALPGRLGIGYNAQFANVTQENGVPGVSLKYSFTRDFGIETVVGVATTDPANTLFALKAMKVIFPETNLNFYGMLGAGYMTMSTTSAIQVLGGFGVEFFIPGLESLGFATEFGGSFDNVSGSYAIKTMGVSFLNAGIHFYF